jgi:starch synthase
MIKVLMVASEAAPFAKTGGLADVVGSLPAALRAFDCEVAVLIPRYRAST